MAHPGEQCFECDACGQSFEQHSELVAHNQTNCGQETREGNFSSEQLPPPSNPDGTSENDWERQKALEQPFECGICGVRFKQLSELVSHTRTHPCGKRITRGKKNSCGNSSNIHGGVPSSGELQQLLPESQYGDYENGFNQYNVKEKPFCEICGKQFASNHSLTRHSVVHSGEKPFECEVCGKRLTRRDKLLAHTRTHTKENSTVEKSGEKPFECGICGKRLTRRDKLLAHARIHTKEVDVEEEEVILPDVIISESFVKQEQQPEKLAVARDQDQPESKPQCEICGKLFACNYNLTRHIRAHFDTRTFDCDVCGKTFNRRDNWMAHYRTHTHGMPSESTASDMMV